MTAIPFRAALWYWLRLGCISFGGPAGQIALMHRELVVEKRWISEARFLHALNFCMLLPGPEAQQLATYIGWLLHRTRGGLAAGLLFVLPSFVLLVGLAFIYVRFGSVPLVAAVLAGLKPAVVALVIQAALRIGSRTLRNAALGALAVAAFIAVSILHTPFPLVIGGALAFGAIGGWLVPSLFPTPAEGTGSETAVDLSANADQPRFRFALLCTVLACAAALWLAPMVGIVHAFGWQSQFAQLGWFFSKAALLTFGGAYAVLPYVYQGAVLHYGWISATQMIDGLALGETTPGPLIMVVTFVGFVAGYESGPLAGVSPLVSGVCAAAIATWYTFLPSFVFVLGGAPWIESTRKRRAFTAPLTAVTAAVVGVIASLALFFAEQVLIVGDRPDVVAIALVVVALIALHRYKVNVVLVLCASGLLGVLRHLAGF